MAAWSDVRTIALSLPATTERESRGTSSWRVADKLFVWERPLRAREVSELDVDAPSGPILGARVEHELAKQTLIAADPGVFFTVSHFNGYNAILVRLEAITATDLLEVVTEAWLCRASARLVSEYQSR